MSRRPGGQRAAAPAPRRPDGVRRPPTRRDANRPPRTTARLLVTHLVGLALEVEAGLRPLQHLRPIVHPALYPRLRRSWVRGGPVRVVLRVGTVVEQGRCDAVAVVGLGHRVGVVALRLRRSPRGGWVVEELARPEDRGPPTPATARGG